MDSVCEASKVGRAIMGAGSKRGAALLHGDKLAVNEGIVGA